MKAFVTGSTGLLGSNLVMLLLEQGYEVKAMARSSQKAKRILGSSNAEIVIGDMQNVEAFAHELDDCDILFHVAAYFREYFQPGEHWPILKAINIDGTVKILEEAEKRGIKKAIYVSSAGVIGTPENGHPADESTPPGQLSMDNLYFRSKVLAEKEVDAFVKTHTMPVVQILPGWMFGPQDDAPTDSGRIVLDFLNGNLPGIIPGGNNVVDARDVAQGMINAVDKGKNGERYIITGEYHSLEEIMQLLGEVSSKKTPGLRIPYPIALSVAWVSETIARLRNQPTLMTVNGLRTLQIRIPISSAKAQRELDVTFRSLRETLRDEVNWFNQTRKVAA